MVAYLCTVRPENMNPYFKPGGLKIEFSLGRRAKWTGTYIFIYGIINVSSFLHKFRFFTIFLAA
jgi:hypothetical protein